MKKVIIIHDEPLTIKIKRNLFIKELEISGLNVLYCDVHKYFYGTLSLVDELQDSNIRQLSSLIEIKEMIFNNKDAFYIYDCSDCFKGTKILVALSKNDCIISSFGIHSSINLSMKEKIININEYGYSKIPFFIRGLADRLRQYIYILFKGRIKESIFFYCGDASYSQKKAQIKKIPINSFDYEDYRLSRDKEPIMHGKYAVFLDEYLPFHPDILLWGNQKLTPYLYYEALNRFFKQIETCYDLDVVIAAHPKSNYSENIFNGRKIIKYQTALLVRDATLVFAHDSLSLSFAVLNMKPIVFLYTNEFYKMGTTIMVLIKKYSSMLNSRLVNIDQKAYDIHNIVFDVDKKSYLKYKYLYLTNESSKKYQNSEIISDFIKKYSLD